MAGVLVMGMLVGSTVVVCRRAWSRCRRYGTVPIVLMTRMHRGGHFCCGTRGMLSVPSVILVLVRCVAGVRHGRVSSVINPLMHRSRRKDTNAN